MQGFTKIFFAVKVSTVNSHTTCNAYWIIKTGLSTGSNVVFAILLQKIPVSYQKHIIG
jgi:hypothetical protein